MQRLFGNLRLSRFWVEDGLPLDLLKCLPEPPAKKLPRDGSCKRLLLAHRAC